MKETAFNILRDIEELKLNSIPNTWLDNDEYMLALKKHYEDGYLEDGSLNLTEKGHFLLETHKVDNAIIMAAGYSARCMPLSEVMPKGLFRVKGELLIEREIEQLIAAGVTQIVVVTGYKADMFDYLKEKYGVILLYNEDYNKYNNIASLYTAKEFMGNSYILCCDNYYNDNVFHQYINDSYYSCNYSEKFCDEFCVTELSDDGYIKGIARGGERSWYTIGDCYFDRAFSKTFLNYLESEWNEHGTKNLLMDDFHIRHIDNLPLYMKKRKEGLIYEFDTIEEIREFDSEFNNFLEENLDKSNIVNNVVSKFSEIKSYHSVPTEQISGRLHLNENLFKPSPKCFEVLNQIKMEDLYLYDLTKKDFLIEKIAAHTGISENNIFVHNGSSEVIKSIFTILLNEGDNVLVPTPGWSYYKSVADAKFANCIEYRVKEKSDTYEYDVNDVLNKAKAYKPAIIVITSPQMPTGCGIFNEAIKRIIEQNPESVIMLDEAYWGYGDDTNEFERELVVSYSNVVITRTFSKFYGLADIRIGYGICSYPLRRTIGLDLPLFRACGISRKIAAAAIDDEVYYNNMKETTVGVREWFRDELNKLNGVTAFNSESNFVFVKIDNADANKIRAFMEENGILIRLFTDNDALRLRITVAPHEIMERVLIQLKKALGIDH